MAQNVVQLWALVNTQLTFMSYKMREMFCPVQMSEYEDLKMDFADELVR